MRLPIRTPLLQGEALTGTKTPAPAEWRERAARAGEILEELTRKAETGGAAGLPLQPNRSIGRGGCSRALQSKGIGCIRRAVTKHGYYSKAAVEGRRRGRAELRALREAIAALMTGC